MKKSILGLMALFAITTSYSQTEQGKMFIGGQVNVSGTTTSYSDSLFKSSSKSNSITITPTFGYFVQNNLAIGANVTLTYNGTKNTDEKTNSTSNSTSLGYGIGGFVRYYSDITDKFKFFLRGSVSILNSESKYTAAFQKDQDYVTNTLTLSIVPGFVYFVTPKFGLETTFGNLNFSSSLRKDKEVSYDNHYVTQNYGLNLNLSTLNFGLCYYF
jgi:hypothetical protein